ncbi:uncharacterized protein LOC126912585 isoform X2 [Spodoptera frugiperda]|uniref:Uncharacterized protein LOC126912585 isoform X2 n=1 Tax=Spodoptera frugiperda TaxID=7108 RepID=A0A9R0E9Q7_SPOFR|nr:uncharacterized protein LOC126912585 isoform X2 [Spodoptera frugiperda]
MPSKPLRDASGRFQSKRPSQGEPNGPSQGQPNGPFQGQPDDISVSDTSRAPSAASLFCRADDSSDCESVTEAVASTSRYLKRAYLRQESDDSSESVIGRTKKAKAKSSSHDVGLDEAQRQLRASLAQAKRVEVQKDLEEKVAAKERATGAARSRAGYGASNVLYADHSVAELAQMALEDKEEILEVASKSSNLKGTFQKALKCRAASLHGIIAELVQRTATDESRQLQARVDRLQAEVSQLHKKLAEATAPAPKTSAATGSSSDLEDIIRKVTQEERAFTRACLAGIEDRLLPEKRVRPPLAADRAPVAMPAPATVPSTSGQPQAPKPSKGKGKGKKSQAAAPLAPSTCADAQVELGTVQAAPLSQPDDAGEPSATPPTETWTEVVKRGKKKKTVPKITPAAPAANRAPAAPLNKGVKLAAPRSAAVTVTITPEAAERGETYESVLTRARSFADPIQLGIGPIKCRRTQTGARLFEFPGAAGSQNADLFAAKLREGIADVAKVARPVKSATLEVVDLDDSVSMNEVVAAIAAAGGCSVEAVHGRTIWTGRRGLGMTRVDCPVTAAKAVLNRTKGRLLIGFSSAVVRALEEQPLRCFKCFGTGHTRYMCPSSAERADTCYRCGKSGHLAASCDATTPHCAVCAASGRPANHFMAGRKCTPPTKKGKMQAPKRPAAANATATATPVTVADAGDEMIE